MAHLIDKSSVVAEINRKIEAHKETLKNCDSSISEMVLKGSMSAYQNLLFFLDTLEVKDVDEIIKNAEDHAYFAGSENTREKLINKACKWWEVELTFPSMTPEEFKLYKSKVRRFRKDMEDET